MSDAEFFSASDEASDAAELLANTVIDNNQATASFIGPNYAVFVVIGRQYVKIAAALVQELHREVVRSGRCLEHELGKCDEDCGARPSHKHDDEDGDDADV